MTTPRSAMQDVAPQLADLTANVLFGDVWERPGLSKRDRSLITVSVLTALYRTGLGEPALAAGRRVGPTGHVLGIDLSADMLAAATDRLRESGLDNVSFREMSADELDLTAASFDAVLCRWSLMFVTDLAATLADLHAVLKPGGRFVAAAWGEPEYVPAISLATRTIYAALDLGPPNEGKGTAFALSDVDAFMRTCRDAGFEDVDSEWVPVAYAFASADDFVAFRTDCARWLTDVMAPFSAAEQAAAWQAVADAVKVYEAEDGTVHMTNQAFCLAAKRPG